MLQGRQLCWILGFDLVRRKCAGKMSCIRRTHGWRCVVDQSGRAGQSGRRVLAGHKLWLNDLGERAPMSMRMPGFISDRHDL